jgi:hypothetical protein
VSEKMPLAEGRTMSGNLHIAITQAPIFLAICTATWPTPPLAPITRTVDPATTSAFRKHSDAVSVTTPAAQAAFNLLEPESLTTLTSDTTHNEAAQLVPMPAT